MPKKIITGEDGKQYQVREKKPWYKRVWVWILIVFVLLIIGGSLGASDDSSSESNSSKKTIATPRATATLNKSYKVGQTVTYKGYSFKVNSVNYYAGNGEMDTPDKKGDQFVIVNVTISNNGNEKQDYNSFDFQLNANGNSTDFDGIITEGKYADNDLDSGTLDKGAKTTGNLIGEAKPGDKLKLEYKPSFWNDKTVDVNLN